MREAVEAGASVIDVGGYSSRPGADEVSPEEEWRRVDLGVGAVRSLSPDLPVSIDTFRSSVAARVIHKYGKVIINDISAGELDPLIVDVAAEHDVPYVAMHMKGNPRTMQSMTDYRDIVAEVVDYFRERTAQLRERGSAASSSIPVSVSPRRSNRTTNCCAACTASRSWAIPCWRACRASR